MTDTSARAAREAAVQGWHRETEILDELERQTAEAAARRDGHVKAVYDTDLTYAEVGTLLGVTAARVGQILTRARSRNDY